MLKQACLVAVIALLALAAWVVYSTKVNAAITARYPAIRLDNTKVNAAVTARYPAIRPDNTKVNAAVTTRYPAIRPDNTKVNAAVTTRYPAIRLDTPSQECSLQGASACLRQAGSRVHRSAAAIGFSGPLPALDRKASYWTYYFSEDEASAAAIWRSGATSWRLPHLRRIPVADLAIDVVVLNVSVAGPAELNEALRMLAPAGLLALAPPAGQERLGGSALARAVLEPTLFKNLFRRKVAMGPGLPTCSDCGTRLHSAELSNCQPLVPKGFVPVTEPRREAAILKEKHLSLGRLRSMPLGNVMKIVPNESSWATRFIVDSSTRFKNQYTNTRNFKKEEFRKQLQSLIAQGNVRSLLDAGAGSCTLDGLLRETGLMAKLQQFVAFGAYDCSQLRICGERGTISLDLTWTNPLPFCEKCLFDMIFQAEGMHHMKTEEAVLKTLDHFTSRLACSGVLYMEDGVKKPEDWNWLRISKKYLTERGYKLNELASSKPSLMAVKPAC